MIIIEKIEIKHFRSFDGGKDQVKVKIDNLKDLNVFSGANDSGKSNILRALNLFFNNEISPGVGFEKDRDFSKIASNRFDKEIETRRKQERERALSASKSGIDEKPRDLRRSDEVVSIKLFFHNQQKQRGLPEQFWISRIYSKKNGFSGQHVYQDNLKGNAQATLFLNSFRFEYVPAIKDKTYFNHLFEKLQNYLFEKEDKSKGNMFAKSSQEFNETLKSETEELFDKFQQSSGVDATFHIPSTLVDFFRTLSVKTENDISLFDRGDGVQARFIPEILNEISKSSKKNIIWGFEEPENSYESKNIRKIRDDFIDTYSRDKQVFITSHTKEFLSIKRRYTTAELYILKSKKYKTKMQREVELAKLRKVKKSSDISIYRIWKNENTKKSSLITRFNENNNAWEDTCDDLGLIQESRLVESLQEILSSQKQEIQDSNLSQKKQKLVISDLNKSLAHVIQDLSDAKCKIEEYDKPILYVEDRYDAIYKISYLKINCVECTENDYSEVFSKHSPFVIRRGEGAGGVAGKLKMPNTDGYEEKKIIGLFDYDKEGTENFYHLQKGNNWEKLVHGAIEDGLYKKRNQHPCFYGMLLPVPSRLRKLVSDVTKGKFESFVEVENLLPEEFLLEHNLVLDEEILTQKYKKIKGNAKHNLHKILVKQPRESFSDFAPLYLKINELFKIQSNE